MGERGPDLGYYFFTCWRENNKLFAARHDFLPTELPAATKAHDGAMTFLWAQDKKAAQVSSMFDNERRATRHGIRRGEVRTAYYESIPMPEGLGARIAAARDKMAVL